MKPTEQQLRDAFVEGGDAYTCGRHTCPYSQEEQQELYDYWWEGYDEREFRDFEPENEEGAL